MPTISEIRTKYPQYKDMSDQQLGDALYKKFYSDMPRDQFDAKVGLTGNSHPEFDASKIPGYDPQTGMVEHNKSDSGVLAGLTSAVNGLPVVGPYLESGVENAAAGIGSLISGEPQAGIRQDMRGMVQSAQAANPITSTVGSVGGAVAGTLPMVLAAPGAFGAGVGGLLGRSIASGLSGAALGGADAGVRSGGDPEAMLSGAKWGGGFGLAGPAVGQAVGVGVRSVTGRFAPQAGSTAERMFSRAAASDSVDDMAGRLAAMGDDAMPMDLGPNLQRQAGALAATPGEAQNIVRSSIADRQAAASGRVLKAADTALGSPADTAALADDIIAKRSMASKPLYEAAYAKNMPWTPELKSLLERPAMRKALSQAQTLAANDANAAPKQFFAKTSTAERPTGVLDASGNQIMAPNTSVQFVRTPNVEELDLTKRALDDMISTAQRQGNGNEARIYTQLKNQLTGLVDKSVPEYASAREAFSGPSAVLDAIDEGGGVFKNSMTPNQLRTRMMKMSPTEKEAFVQGARAQISDMMGTARNDALKIRSEFQKGYNREKLEMLVGKKQANDMLNSLDAETAFSRTRDVVTGNSETAARTAARKEISGAPYDPASSLREIDISKPLDLAARIGGKVSGKISSAIQERTNAELARLLTSRDPAAITRTIKMVQAAQRRGDISADKARQMVQAVMIGGTQKRQPLEITVTPNRVPARISG